MPTVLTWTYWGEHHVDEENGDVQRIKPGGIADDDTLGEVTIISLDTGIFTVETGAMGADKRSAHAMHIFPAVGTVQREEFVTETLGWSRGGADKYDPQ